MPVDCLIVGQGICGTFLSLYLKQAGLSVRVIDQQRPDSPSSVAAGLINPVTGRRVVKTWMIDELIPFCKESYTLLGKMLNITGIYERPVIDFFPNTDVRNAFFKKAGEGLEYIHTAETSNFREWFNYELGYGTIRPAFVANLKEILPAYRKLLLNNHELYEEVFDPSLLIINENSVSYKQLQFKYIFFCDGMHSYYNPWFSPLPFALNKGEALIIKAAGIPDTFTFKKSLSIIHLENDFYWVGGSYEWNFTNTLPSEAFLEQTKKALDKWLKIPYTVEQQLAAIRPATVERRPFVGMHPVYKHIGILNGMGTKGCSLAPYFANKLTQLVTQHRPLEKEASVNRFDNLLRNSIMN